MDDIQQAGDQQIKETTDSKQQTSDNVQKQAQDGMQSQTDSVKNYYQERREGGARSTATRENLPPQPAFYDSGMDAASARNALDGKTADNFDPKSAVNQLDRRVTADPLDGGAPPGGAGGPVERDDQGRPTKISYDNGTSTEVSYGADNQPEKIKAQDGTTWQKENEKWNHYDSDGKQLSSGQVGGFNVTPEGDVVAVRPDGTPERIRHADGSRTDFGEDGTSQMTRDSQDRPTSMTYPDGKTTKVNYGDDGKVSEVKAADGSTWKHEGDQWNRYGTDGKPMPGAKVGDFQVTDEGDVAALSPDGKPIGIRHPDGSRTDYGDDGTSQITRDNKDRPSSITYPDGKTTKVTYGDDGQPSEVGAQDGTTWKRENDGTWKHYGQNGAPTDRSDVGGFKVDENGDVTAVDRNGKPIRTRHADGSKTEF